MPDQKNHRKIFRQAGIYLTAIMVSLLVAGCSTGFIPQGKESAPAKPPSVSADSPTNGLVQSSAEGPVTVEVKWLGPNDGQLSFAVTINTHSVDLDRYDLGKLAVLRDDEGREYHPTLWDSAPGGHHRQGTLVFSHAEKVKYLELVISGVAGVKERIFRWDFR